MQIARRRRTPAALALGTAAAAVLALAAAPAADAATFPCTLGKATSLSSGTVTIPITCTTGGKLSWSDRAGFTRSLTSGYDTAEPTPDIAIKPSSKGFRKLRHTCPLKVKVRVRFAPSGGGASSSVTKRVALRHGSHC